MQVPRLSRRLGEGENSLGLIGPCPWGRFQRLYEQERHAERKGTKGRHAGAYGAGMWRLFEEIVRYLLVFRLVVGGGFEPPNS